MKKKKLQGIVSCKTDRGKLEKIDETLIWKRHIIFSYKPISYTIQHQLEFILLVVIIYLSI